MRISDAPEGIDEILGVNGIAVGIADALPQTEGAGAAVFGDLIAFRQLQLITLLRIQPEKLAAHWV